MLTVLCVRLPSQVTLVGCEIAPSVLLQRPDGNITTDDVPESAPINGCFVRYKWYSHLGDQKFAVCSVHPTEKAALQCMICVNEKVVPITKSYHCTATCFSDSWRYHRNLHDLAKRTVSETGANYEVSGHLSSGASTSLNSGISGRAPTLGQTSRLNTGPVPTYPTTVANRSVEAWSEVGFSRTYTPSVDDINHILKLECVVLNAETRLPVGDVSSTLTSRVIPAPAPTPRCMIPVNAVNLGHLNTDDRIASSGTFSVLSYNILADVYATSDAYNHCPTWALSWPYRRQNLLREIICYHADILCLQEVQYDHYEEFFAPELEKHGFQAVYKKRTSEIYAGNPNSIDGCAIFFRSDRFAHVKKYEVDFNKAAQSLTDVTIQPGLKNVALGRLIKDNVALIVVLEAKFSNQSTDNPGKRQLLCVANTHVDVHHELKEVKIWQVHTLLKGLERIAASADIPMLVCGDFGSVPGSAAHALLVMGKIDQLHPDLFSDPLGILRPTNKLTHQLPLVSAYSSFARAFGFGYELQQQMRKMDPTTNEPLFTNYTRDFVGTLDYIFYTADSLSVESLLELLDEESLRINTALPSPERSSDHVGLVAEFRCKSRDRR